MNVNRIDNKIFFNDEEKAFANITIGKYSVKIELLKVEQAYRGMKLASNLLSKIISFIKTNILHVKEIVLSPLPLEKSGLNIDELISFYERYSFIKPYTTPISEPFRMVKYI